MNLYGKSNRDHHIISIDDFKVEYIAIYNTYIRLKINVILLTYFYINNLFIKKAVFYNDNQFFDIFYIIVI